MKLALRGWLPPLASGSRGGGRRDRKSARVKTLRSRNAFLYVVPYSKHLRSFLQFLAFLAFRRLRSFPYHETSSLSLTSSLTMLTNRCGLHAVSVVALSLWNISVFALSCPSFWLLQGFISSVLLWRSAVWRCIALVGVVQVLLISSSTTSITTNSKSLRILPLGGPTHLLPAIALQSVN